MISRTFEGGPVLTAPRGEDADTRRRLGIKNVGAHQLTSEHLDLINAALLCRRPLLVSGAPGLGKSSLAYAIARELRLGPVLEWPISSRTTVQEGLYHYDALRRFEEARLPLPAPAAEPRRSRAVPVGDPPPAAERRADVSDYLTLGPLGTALLPWDRPRVLLIDEVDKADVDLPNDLLHAFEDGRYQIDELFRMRDYQKKVSVTTFGSADRVEIVEGQVLCSAFPIVVMTSNGEREFPAAFLRRCLHLRLTDPERDQLERIVAAHLGDDAVSDYGDIITTFLHRRTEIGTLPADRLLIAIHILREAGRDGDELSGDDRVALARRLIQPVENAV